jgi:26S proteasome regulatory subunit N10
MEATIVCIDNSEWTRSGDYAPTRFQAQADAVNLLAGAKTQANPENTVGVLTMAGKTPRVLVTPTPDLGKVLNCMSDIDMEPECNLAASVQIAQLALKHRQNKNQRQRIVIFVGSPVAEDKVGRRAARTAGVVRRRNDLHLSNTHMDALDHDGPAWPWQQRTAHDTHVHVG